MPSSRSSSRAAWMPSQVDAILMRMRSFLTPTESYSAMSSLAFFFVASLSKERRASTSVETRPGIIFRISFPNSTIYTSRAVHRSAVEEETWACEEQ